MGMTELGQRLADPDRAAQMSDAVLARMVDSANKTAERRAIAEAAAQDQQEEQTPLAVILLSPLPRAQKIQMIEIEAAKIKEDYDLYMEAVYQLKEQEKNA